MSNQLTAFYTTQRHDLNEVLNMSLCATIFAFLSISSYLLSHQLQHKTHMNARTTMQYIHTLCLFTRLGRDVMKHSEKRTDMLFEYIIFGVKLFWLYHQKQPVNILSSVYILWVLAEKFSDSHVIDKLDYYAASFVRSVGINANVTA